jgi:glucose/arabinose dehydrogenase
LRRRRLLAELTLVGLVAGVVLVVALAAAGTRVDAQTTDPSTTSSTRRFNPPPGPTTTSSSIPALAPVDVKLTMVARLPAPTSLAVRRDDPRLYVTLQGGELVAIRAASAGATGAKVTRVLDLRDRVAAGREQGLLGLAFSPDGTQLFVTLTERDDSVVLESYPVRTGSRRSPDVDLDARRTLLQIAKPAAQHNGGQLAFGPDGMLYMSIGDGGGHGDMDLGRPPSGNAQSLDTLLGKILRIDPRPSATLPYTIPPDNPYANGGGRPEIWAYGLRNPWRFSFDRATHDLWIADVGEAHWEEIDYVAKGRAAGLNFGWNLLEATHPFRAATAPGTVAPILELRHRMNWCAVAGGYVYRGTRIPDLGGLYLFADYCSGKVHALRQQSGKVAAVRYVGLKAPLVSSFGEDGSGELYVLSRNKGVLRIDPS